MESFSTGYEKKIAAVNKPIKPYETANYDISPDSVFHDPGLTRKVGYRSSQSQKLTETIADLRKPFVLSAKTPKKVQFNAQVLIRTFTNHCDNNDDSSRNEVSEVYVKLRHAKNVKDGHLSEYYHSVDKRLDAILAKKDAGIINRIAAIDTALLPTDQLPPFNMLETAKSLTLELIKILGMTAGTIATAILFVKLLPNKDKK